MNQDVLRQFLFTRYINILFIALFASDIPMPVNKEGLLICSSAALGGNFLVHLFWLRTGQTRLVSYFLLGLDLITIVPALYFSGMVLSPFLVVLPLTLFTVYFVSYSASTSIRFGLTCIGLFVFFVVIWWSRMEPVPSWSPAEYPFYTAFIALAQVVSLAAIIYQSRMFPLPMVHELEIQEATLARQRHKVEIGTSISMIVHEIRNPLTTASLCLGQIAALNRQSGQEARKKLSRRTKTSREELGRIEEMLEIMLSYAREKTGRYNFTAVPATTLVHRALAFIHLKYGRHQAKFHVRSSIPEGILLWCDSDAIHQVLVNLLDNSFQHRHDIRPLHIEIGLAENETTIMLTLRDNGIGISAERLPRIFDHFISGRPSGTGLGLSIVRRIVEDHGGHTQLESTEGAGTTAIVSLPRSSEKLTDTQTPRSSRPDAEPRTNKAHDKRP